MDGYLKNHYRNHTPPGSCIPDSRSVPAFFYQYHFNAIGRHPGNSTRTVVDIEKQVAFAKKQRSEADLARRVFAPRAKLPIQASLMAHFWNDEGRYQVPLKG